MAQIDKMGTPPPKKDAGKKIPPELAILLAKANEAAKKNTKILDGTETDIGITEKILKEKDQGKEA